MATNSERGGFQPTSEEQARDALGCHKDDLELRIAQMEKTLAAIRYRGGLLPFEVRDFFYQARDTLVDTRWTRIKDLKKAWIEIKAQFDRPHTIAGQERLQGLQVYHATLQRRYLEVHACAKDALDDDKHRSGSRNCSNPPRKPRRSHMPTSGVTAASSQVTKLPSALKTSYSIKATLVMT